MIKENIIKFQNFASPIGDLVIGSFHQKICLCDWLSRKNRANIDQRLCQRAQAKMVRETCPSIDQTIAQLNAYFEQTITSFNLNLHLLGSKFQMKVWNELLKVPYGQVTTYKQLAIDIGLPNHVRAVANANGANAISILIPCHRVIGSHGKLTGYAGGLEAKRKLLQLEGIKLNQIPLLPVNGEALKSKLGNGRAQLSLFD